LFIFYRNYAVGVIKAKSRPLCIFETFSIVYVFFNKKAGFHRGAKKNLGAMCAQLW
jgi:hypothetical protein